MSKLKVGKIPGGGGAWAVRGLLIVVTLIVLVTWWKGPDLVLWRMNHFRSNHPEVGDQLKPGEFGDQFGSLNTLFSGLALLGVVGAILLQQRDLALQCLEMKKSSGALRKQVQIASIAARLQVNGSLANSLRERVFNSLPQDEQESFLMLEASLNFDKAFEAYMHKLERSRILFQNRKAMFERKQTAFEQGDSNIGSTELDAADQAVQEANNKVRHYLRVTREIQELEALKAVESELVGKLESLESLSEGELLED